MRTRSIIAVAAALAVTAEGQEPGTKVVRWEAAKRATTTTAAAGATHTVLVGAEGFKFSPNQYTNVPIGDIIEFRLYPGNHTVARSDFGTPCLPYEYTGLNRQGFFSGYIGPQVITNDLPKLQVRVNDTEPIFFYCTAPGSCFQQHMIGVVNPNSTETLDLQEQYAINATTQLAPGEPFPSETLNPTSTPSASNTNSPGAGSDDHEHHGLSAGAIAGIAIGGAAVLCLAGALVFLCGRRGGLDKAYRRSTQTFPPPVVENKYQPSNPKSPGQETYSTAHYSNDPYRTNSPHTFASSPPPLTPNSHPAYTYSSAAGHPNVQSPLMAGMTDGTQGY
ncbi:hypothetical protein CONLIGDRAFT_5741 [Coniochaeta ligniaria NRRL 30616]|uniref:Cupredoxin n=1 Tax=Coniochaeta ligniaria NRRL 30616 TaxID=1408157 RepID=A0A1J7JWL3_9PEZI|nr:hypothetical protein CONLIGDRAFT_5741 [Coniochaeta ligniaria NRRL 30616]